MESIKTQLIAEVARIIGLPIIPMVPTAVHDSKPFPHLVQYGNGRLFLDGQLFDPVENPVHFLLVEAWLERSGMRLTHAIMRTRSRLNRARAFGLVNGRFLAAWL